MRLCLITLVVAIVAQGAMHSYEETLRAGEDHREVAELLQTEDSEAQKTCPDREEETTKLLKAYQAARLVQKDSPRYGIHDETTDQLVSAWGALYKSSRAKFVFYCTQTKEDLHAIAAAVKKKEVVAVQNAAQAGLLAAQAAMKQKRKAAEKAHKSAVQRAAEEAKEKALQKKRAQEKTVKMTQAAIKKNIARLRGLPSITRHLYGKVRNAATGKPIAGAEVTISCLFKTTKGVATADGQFTLGGAISGPIGRQCDMLVAMKGYAPSKTPITVAKVNTDSIYSEAMLLPTTADQAQYRFVLQYGAMPPNLDAHIIVPQDGTFVDVAENKLGGGGRKVTYGGAGSATKSPFVTLDHFAHRFGPEMLTVHKVQDGVYHFVVVNAAQSFTDARQFAASQARAFLYQGNKVVATMTIDSARGDVPTQMWYVLALTCKKEKCSIGLKNRFVASNPALQA